MNPQPQTEAEQALTNAETQTRNIARMVGVLYQELCSQGLPPDVIQALLLAYFGKLIGMGE